MINKIVKSIPSLTLPFPTLLPLTTTLLPIQHTPHPPTNPYYLYNPYLHKHPKFLTNQLFIKPLKYQNLTINPIKFQKPHTNKQLQKYNQKFTALTKHPNN
ncbi:immunodominant staphylococcal antigen IsaB family protein, partial [Staphylococcus hominis]